MVTSNRIKLKSEPTPKPFNHTHSNTALAWLAVLRWHRSHRALDADSDPLEGLLDFRQVALSGVAELEQRALNETSVTRWS
jgi:hypothetical protein